MSNNLNKKRVVLLLARVWGTIILIFLVLMLGSQILGLNEQSEGFQSTKEMAAFFCFPVSTIIGLAVAWKSELHGGLITVVGLVVFFILLPELASNMYAIAAFATGLLYLYYAYQLKNKE